MSTTTTKKNLYYAFFDAEYTCFMDSDTFFDKTHGGEVLSVGVVICDKSFRLLKTYYSTIRPLYNKRLTGYCKKLTGLTQQEIDAAPGYDDVFQELFLLFQTFPVKEIYTWGNDAHTILHDMDVNHKTVPKRYRKLGLMLTDITRRLTRKIYNKNMTLSLSDMKYICGMGHMTAHNALDDAMDLYKVTKCCLQGKYDKEAAERLEEYIHERDAYHHYRRFKKQPDWMKTRKKPGRKEEFYTQSEKYLALLQAAYGNDEGKVPVEIRALCDDILSLLGRESEYLPKLEE